MDSIVMYIFGTTDFSNFTFTPDIFVRLMIFLLILESIARIVGGFSKKV